MIVIQTWRRTLLYLAVAILAVGLFGIACGGDDDKSGGTLNVALQQDTNGLDPAFHLSTADVATTLHAYDGLVWRKHDGILKPMLAETWEASSDLSSYTFNLRKGVKFHHGKELKAEDVVYSFKRLIDPDVGSGASGALANIIDIVAVDDRTVRFDLDGPNSFFDDTLSLYQGKILPSDIPEAQLANAEFGTGAFTISNYVAGERVEYTRNPDYFDADIVELEGMVFFYIPEPETRVEALKGGSVHVVGTMEVAFVEGVESHPDTRVSETGSAAYINFAMDSRQTPFDDIGVRKALTLLTDREAIRQVALFGRGLIGNDHPIPPNSPYYDQSQTQTPYDPAAAKALLAEAGYPKGLEIDLHTSTIGPGMVELAVAFKESAVAGGVKVNVIQQPEDKYWADIWLTEPFTAVAWNGRNPDQAFSIVYHSDAAWNESFIKNPAVDALLAEARAQASLEGRQAKYAELQLMVREDYGRIVPVFRPIFMGLRNNVREVEAHPNNWPYFMKAYLES